MALAFAGAQLLLQLYWVRNLFIYDERDMAPLEAVSYAQPYALSGLFLGMSTKGMNVLQELSNVSRHLHHPLHSPSLPRRIYLYPHRHDHPAIRCLALTTRHAR
jgi:hypothetical protein